MSDPNPSEPRWRDVIWHLRWTLAYILVSCVVMIMPDGEKKDIWLRGIDDTVGVVKEKYGKL